MILYDFYCYKCEAKFESMAKSDEMETECEECGDTASRLISAPRVGMYNDPNVRADALKKRSYDHSVRQAKKHPEAHAAKVGGKPRSQSSWNIRSPKTK